MAGKLYGLLNAIFAFVLSGTASAGWINADDFSLGSDVTSAVSGVKLGWVRHESGSPELLEYSSVIGQNPYYHNAGETHQVFGSSNGSMATYEVDNSGYSFQEYPLDQTGEFEAFTATFSKPVRSFGFALENESSDDSVLLLFDPIGNYLKTISTGLLTWQNNPDCYEGYGPCFKYRNIFTFDTDIGSVLLGADGAATYVSSIFVPVPEPSAISLLTIVLVGFGLTRLERNGRKV